MGVVGESATQGDTGDGVSGITQAPFTVLQTQHALQGCWRHIQGLLKEAFQLSGAHTYVISNFSNRGKVIDSLFYVMNSLVDTYVGDVFEVDVKVGLWQAGRADRKQHHVSQGLMRFVLPEMSIEQV